MMIDWSFTGNLAPVCQQTFSSSNFYTHHPSFDSIMTL